MGELAEGNNLKWPAKGVERVFSCEIDEKQKTAWEVNRDYP